MAKGSRGGRRSAIAPIPAKGSSITQSNTPAQAIGNLNGVVTRNYQNFDDNDASNIIKTNVDTYQDPDFVDAQKLYISAKGDSNGFSYSQNLNYKLDNGLPLNATERFIDSNIQKGMHDLGKDSNLVRFAHDDILQKMGVSDYTKMSNSQLQSLIGTEIQTTAYLSTSYNGNKSPFHPNNPLGGGREVVMNVKASSTSKVVLGEKSQSEVIINKGTKLKLTGIHFDGTYAHPRLGGTKPRIVLDFETV